MAKDQKKNAKSKQARAKKGTVKDLKPKARTGVVKGGGRRRLDQEMEHG